MAIINLEIEVDDEFVDFDHASGLTEEGHEALTDAVNRIGMIHSGPTRTLF